MPRTMFAPAPRMAVLMEASSSSDWFAEGQNFGLPSIAAMRSRASARAGGTPGPASAAASSSNSSESRMRSAVAAAELLLDPRELERLDQRREIAVDDGREVVRGVVDPVVGDAVLREIVGA